MSGRACHCRFGRFLKIEVVCSKQRGVFPCQGSLLLKIRWLTLQHGYVHALCFSSSKKKPDRNDIDPGISLFYPQDH
jgi:hypothetical protein